MKSLLLIALAATACTHSLRTTDAAVAGPHDASNPDVATSADQPAVPLPGCPTDGVPTLGCPCSAPGTTACNAAIRPNKVPLLCTAGLWALNGATCKSDENCQWDLGLCVPIDPQCAAGHAYCAAPHGEPYSDVLATCGPDLTWLQTTTHPCAGLCGVDIAGSASCQPPRCGDGKVESGEQCDDGNDIPLDGCEPASAPLGAACSPSKVVSLSLGGRHACALYGGGYTRCWGNNERGQLGLGHREFQGDLKPYQLTNGDRSKLAGPIDLGGPAVDVKAGFDFTCALLADQSVRCWGNNDDGQLGLGNSSNQDETTPIALGPINLGGPVLALSVGDQSACAILSDGSLRCWGDNSSGVLGLGDTSSPSPTTTPNLIPVVNLGGTKAVAVSAGAYDTCVLMADGTLRCFGENYFGELGLGTRTNPSPTQPPTTYGPVPLLPDHTGVAVTVGSNYVCALLNDGQAQCWGRNLWGQLGIGTTLPIGDDETAASGAIQAGGQRIASISAGVAHTCAIFAENGALRCWGNNFKGQLGYPDLNHRGDTSATVPGALPPISFGQAVTASAVFVANYVTCALLTSGEVRCWGWNNSGQLGLGFVSQDGTRYSTAPLDYVGGDSLHTPDVASATTAQLLPPK